VNYLSYLLIPLAFWCYHLRREVRDCRQALAECQRREKDLVGKLVQHPINSSLPESPEHLADLTPPRLCMPDTRETLNPHFLFNSLNTIRYFVRTNTGKARELLLDLSLVLQAALRTESHISLRDELENGRAYLRLEQARVGERLEVDDSVLDDHLDKWVPSRLLLPLLQSLVRGVAERSAGGTITISLLQDTLILESDAAINLPEHLPECLTVTTEPHPRIQWRLK
jgi:histidine kinase